MKKKILFAIHYLEIGGAESALIGLLHSMDYSRYEIDLFLANHQGELMAYLPPQVHLLSEKKQYASLALPIRETMRNGCYMIAVSRLWAKFRCKLYLLRNHLKDNTSIYSFIANSTKNYLPVISEKEYDAAICYLFHKEIFFEKVRAKKKIVWIHTDWSSVDANVSLDLPAWGAFDTIVSISKDVTRTFVLRFPSLASKVVEIENILPITLIRSRAKEISEEIVRREMPLIPEEYNILSIGRFSEAKNFDNIPNICRRIRETGVNIRWYIIGYGSDEDLIRSKIAEEGMEEVVIILGKKSNPYPYLLACDIYAQPSRYEGKSVTVREAQCMGKPVIVSAYPTATSQIQTGVDGVIVPMDNEGFAKGMCDFIMNRALREKISSYLIGNDFASKEEIDKLYKLI